MTATRTATREAVATREEATPTRAGEHVVPRRPAPGRRRRRPAHRAARSADRFLFRLGVLAIVVGGVGLRLYRINRSYDVFVDEISYLRIGQNVSTKLSVSLYGKPFFLHPPGFFFLEAIVLRVVHLSGQVLADIQTMRNVNVVLAGLTTLLLIRLVQPVAGRWAALAAGALFALDPFIIRQNDRVLLETNALVWVVAGYVVLLPLTTAADRRLRHVTARAVAGGALFGIAVLSNDVNAFLTVLPLAVCFLLGWAMPRRQIAVAAVVCCLSYVPYVAAVALSGDWAAFASQKVQGALRLAGTVQTTGFNRPASVPLATKLTQDIGQFAPTYCLIGIGAIACVVLARSRSQPRRLLAAWAGSAFVFLAYAIGFGTIEEQMFYYLVVPALVVTTVATEWLWRTTRFHERHHRAVVVATCVAATIFVAAATSAYVQVHTTTDDGYDRLVAYLDANVPARSTIAISAATETADFVLDRFSAQKWGTVAQLIRNRAQYAVVSTKAVSQGYSRADPALVPWLRLHATPLWSYKGASVGDLILYRLSPAPTVPG